VNDWERTDDGLRVEVDDELHDGDQVFWGGMRCDLQADGSDAAPTSFADPTGRELAIKVVEDWPDHTWRIRVEGRVEHSVELSVDGRAVRYEVEPELAGLGRLFDSSGTA